MTQATTTATTAQFIRFIVVLVIGAGIDLGVMNVTLWLLGRTPPTPAWVFIFASACGFSAGLISNFVLHRVWTFRNTRQSAAEQFPRFVAVSLSALVLRLALVALAFPLIASALGALISDAVARNTLSANVTQLAAMSVSMVWNYVANRRWTYR